MKPSIGTTSEELKVKTSSPLEEMFNQSCWNKSQDCWNRSPLRAQPMLDQTFKFFYINSNGGKKKLRWFGVEKELEVLTPQHWLFQI